MRTGILLAIVGVFLIARTVTKDISGRTLIDHILGKKPAKIAAPAHARAVRR